MTRSKAATCAGFFSQCGSKLVAPDQVRADALQPLRLDARDAACEEARGLGELGRHDPAPGLLAHARAGVDQELDAARAEVVLAVLGLAADVAEQAGEQRAVDLRVARRSFSDTFQPMLGDEGVQLAVDVAPLAHARCTTGSCRGTARRSLRLDFLCASASSIELPQLEEGEEIRLLVLELGVRRVGRAGALQRPLARVLHATARRR